MKILLMVFAFVAAEVELNAITLQISQVGDCIQVALINDSRKSVTVNKSLSWGPSLHRSNLVFIVTDSSGEPVEFTARVNYRDLFEADFIALTPNELIGYIYEVESVRRSFSLKPGSYSMRAIYKSRTSGVGDGLCLDQITSNVVSFTIRPPLKSIGKD